MPGPIKSENSGGQDSGGATPARPPAPTKQKTYSTLDYLEAGALAARNWRVLRLMKNAFGQPTIITPLPPDLSGKGY